MKTMVELGAEYQAIRGQFELAAQHVKDIIALQTASFKVHDIEYRAKSTESFIKKCVKKDEFGNLKYTDPFRQITDFAGVRLICFLKKDVDPICERIISIFKSDGVEDVGERIFQKGRFGYQSKHILVKLTKDMYLPSCNLVDDVFCEIQVRTLLQHAWAEIEHDIQYKGDVIPDRLRKRFVSLAGLLEIADGEFERIQEESDSLISDIQNELVSNLTEEVLNTESVDNSPEEIRNIDATVSVRSLVSAGRYEEALQFYDAKLLAASPSHTLYIGRAKVKFLLGDVEGALTDLDRARGIKPDDPAIQSLLDRINHGNNDASDRPAAKSVNPIEIGNIFRMMGEGKGKEAFAAIVDLEPQGYPRPFAQTNKAACCLLEDDTVGADEFLSKLSVFIGTPNSVNIHIMKLTSQLMRDESFAEELNELNIILSAVPHFLIELSPIAHFFKGLRIRNRVVYNKIEKLFSTIPQLKLPR